MENKKAVILLSGGLDSVAALSYVINKQHYEVVLALTFDYGQKAVKKEIESSAKISEYYGIEHKVIKLDWLKSITETGLVSDIKIPEKNLNTPESAKSVWVPNRNALFLNIAASFCDAYDYKYIIYGANKDEGQTFPDNTDTFRSRINEMFECSTLVKPEVIAPLINYGKDDIVKIAVAASAPLEYIWSCYKDGDRHCGKCESCSHLQKALSANQCEDYITKLF